MSWPTIRDIGVVCIFVNNVTDDCIPALILNTSKSMDISSNCPQWVDIMLPNGKIESVAPWKVSELK